MKLVDRRQDAHEKIKLGGLVVKANLRDESKDVILGILLDASEKITGNEKEKYLEYYRIIGEKEFLKDRIT